MRIGEYLKAVHDGHAAMRPAAPALPHPSLPR
jgi:hypothetical protein